MMEIVLWILGALLVAGGVLFLAARVDSRRTEVDGSDEDRESATLGRLWHDVTAGASSVVHGDFIPSREERDSGAANTSVDDFFDAAATSEPGYLEAEEINTLLHRRHHDATEDEGRP